MRRLLAQASIRPVYMTSNGDMKLGTYVYEVGHYLLRIFI